jgi:hypothetical protein
MPLLLQAQLQAAHQHLAGKAQHASSLRASRQSKMIATV